MKDRLKAVKVWFLRRMLRISWTEKKGNGEVLTETALQRTLMKRIHQRPLAFPRQVLGRHGLENLAVTGRIEERREGASETEVCGRGGSRKNYLGGLAPHHLGGNNG